ncbi:hypothetical protein EIL50_04675 [bacterium NHP-B]|nr:hypothetical protein EIL50_04675 [bacterium NHP-B]
MTRTGITKDILKTALPLVLSIVSYPLFTIVFLAIINRYFSSDLSPFIVAQSFLVMGVRFSENLLSGTRVLTARLIGQTPKRNENILKASWVIAFCLSFFLCVFAILFWIVSLVLLDNAFCKKLAPIIFFLALGLPGSFFYSACAYYLHAHKKTQTLPFVSWISNTIGVSLMYCYGSNGGSSFEVCLLLAALSRTILGIFAYLAVLRYLKEGAFLKRFPCIQDILDVLKPGVSYALKGLLFTGNYFLFTLFIERFATHTLATFQFQMNVLNILTVINVSLASSGCILLTHVPLKNVILRYKIFTQNFLVSGFVFVVLWSGIFLLQQEVIVLMGQNAVSLVLFRQTFFILSALHALDLCQTILVQVMTYNNDYFIPPLLRIGVFSVLAIPLAWLSLSYAQMSLKGLLLSILSATFLSNLTIIKRFARLKNRFFLIPQKVENSNAFV